MKNQLALTLTPQDESQIVFFEIGEYEFLSNAVGGLFECVSLNNGVEMWVNENFIAESLEYNPTATGIYWSNFGFMSGNIQGTVIFTSSNDEGETIGLDVEQIEYLKRIAFDIIGIKPQLPYVEVEVS